MNLSNRPGRKIHFSKPRRKNVAGRKKENSYTEAINHLRYEKPNLQICFRTEKALSLLYFEGSERI